MRVIEHLTQVARSESVLGDTQKRTGHGRKQPALVVCALAIFRGHFWPQLFCGSVIQKKGGKKVQESHTEKLVVKMLEQKLLKFLPGEQRGWESSGTGTPAQTPLFHLCQQIRDMYETDG